MYSLLGRDVLTLCDKYRFCCCCTMKVVQTCHEHLDLDVLDFTQLVGCPDPNVSELFWPKYIRIILN